MGNMKLTKTSPLPPTPDVRQFLAAASQARVLVLGDVMLDHFLWGKVDRISPEAPVPIVEFQRESFIPGGAGNVARNLADLKAHTELFGVVGDDPPAHHLKQILKGARISCSGLLTCPERVTSTGKTRIIARASPAWWFGWTVRAGLHVDEQTTGRVLAALDRSLRNGDALILGDYAKGVVSQHLLDQVRNLCRLRGVWLSVDPKPSHQLNLSRVSLLTPNRKEAFELAGVPDSSRGAPPLKDSGLMRAADKLLTELQPALLLITLGDQGMLLCQHKERPHSTWRRRPAKSSMFPARATQ